MQNNLISKKLIIDFKNSYKKLKLNKVKNIYITSNLTSISNLRLSKKRQIRNYLEYSQRNNGERLHNIFSIFFF